MKIIDLYTHQAKAVVKMKNGCILCGGVGTGKSRTSLAYYAIQNGFSMDIENGAVRGAFHSPRPLYIITTAKKRDSYEWDEECRIFDVPDFKVDSWNNIKKYTKIYGAFFIFDEQRVVGYGKWSKAFINISRKNQWILLSATPGDTWSDYIPVFIANGFYRTKTEFLARHAVFSRFSKYPKIDKYIDQGVLVRHRLDILVTMPFKRSTVPHNVFKMCEYDKKLYKTVWRDRWDPYDNCPIEETGKLCYLLRKVVNSDPSRLDILGKVLAQHKKLIVFYNYDYELDLMRGYLAQFKDCVVAEWNGQKHEEVPNSKCWVYLVQYAAGCEGWNCIETDVILFYSQSYSYRMTIQAAGRIDRMNTKFKDLYYYKLKSVAPIDLAISRALDSKKNFNERAFCCSK